MMGTVTIIDGVALIPNKRSLVCNYFHFITFTVMKDGEAGCGANDDGVQKTRIHTRARLKGSNSMTIDKMRSPHFQSQKQSIWWKLLLQLQLRGAYTMSSNLYGLSIYQDLWLLFPLIHRYKLKPLFLMLILNQQLPMVWLNSDPQNGGLIRKILRGAMGIRVHQLYRNNIPRDMWDPIVSNSGSDQEDQLKRQRVMPDQRVVSKHPCSATLTDDWYIDLVSF